jgi:prepilin-type N-terminal cleavage/methylation domain-containing protein
MKTSRGFTLLEVLLATALVGLLLAGLNIFIFSMGELWGKNSDRRLFDQHVNAVTRYLQRELRAAGLPPAGKKGEYAITPQEIRPGGGLAETLLTFDLPGGSRLFEWPAQPLPEVVCSLQVRERQGLFLLWHSRLETRFYDDPPREVLVTPWATEMSYEYYDSDTKRWSIERALKRESSSSRAYLVPQRIRLKFAYRGLQRETVLLVPTVTEGLPNY